MNETKWYKCKQDIGVTIILILCAFSSTWICSGHHDGWILWPLFAAILSYINCLFLCRKHFWVWTIIGMCLFNLASLLGDEIPQDWIKNIGIISLISLYFSLYISLLVLPMTVFILNRKNVAFLLLLPIGWLAGMEYTNLRFNAASEIIGFETSFYLALVSGLIIAVAVLLDYNTLSIKKHNFFKCFSLITCLPAGLIPGYVYFDWRFSLFATLLPIIGIYNYYELSKVDLIERQNREII